MIYYIGYIPPKEFQDFYSDLVRDVSKRFELNGLAQKNRVPHITLKSPFEISSPQSLDETVSNFCQNQEPSSIEINGVGSFGKEVIFLHSQPSTQMSGTFRKLLDNLRGVGGIDWNEYDNPNKKLHITLAKGKELEGKFQDVYDYLKAQDIKFTLPFNNITIFQKDGGRTFVHRTYVLSKKLGS
jgi:2'-5' RNA ligase